MKHFVAKVCLVAVGVLALPGIANQRPPVEIDRHLDDPRLEKLKAFFREWDSPGEQYAAEFLTAADSYALDWRLLPSICLVESGCGKDFRNNNVFGWNSCTTGFHTVRGGIWVVASRLATSPLYEGKPLDDVLHTYNPRRRYRRLVRRLMSSLDPATGLPVQATD